MCSPPFIKICRGKKTESEQDQGEYRQDEEYKGCLKITEIFIIIKWNHLIRPHLSSSIGQHFFLSGRK